MKTKRLTSKPATRENVLFELNKIHEVPEGVETDAGMNGRKGVRSGEHSSSLLWFGEEVIVWKGIKVKKGIKNNKVNDGQRQ